MLSRPPRVSPALKGLLAALFYGVVSISITFFNKAVLSSYAFRYPNLMTLFQMAFSLLLLVVAKATKSVTYPDFSVETAKRVSPLAISFIGMVLTGLGALNHLNIPMFNALRQVTTLITMFSEFYLLNIRASVNVRASVYIMVGGAILAGITDPTYSSTGYFLVALNCIFTAMYLLCIAKFSNESQSLGTFGLMFYNNLLSLPFVIIICWFTGDFAAFTQYQYISDKGFIFCFTLQSALAFILNYSIFLCTNVNSALTTSVTGQVKNIMTTALGFFMFGDVKYNTWNVMGLLVSLAASCIYSYLKYLESEAKKAQKRKDEASTPAAPNPHDRYDPIQQSPAQSPDPYHHHTHSHAVHVNIHPQANLHSRDHTTPGTSSTLNNTAAAAHAATSSYAASASSSSSSSSVQPVFSINSTASSAAILNLNIPHTGKSTSR